MDRRTMLREIDELMSRTQSTIAREAALVDALPNCRLRRRKQARLRTMRAYAQRLGNFRRDSQRLRDRFSWH